MAEFVEFRVAQTDHGQRLDRCVAATLRTQGFDVSNRTGKSLVEQCDVKVDSQVVNKASTRVAANQVVRVDMRSVSVTAVSQPKVDLSALVIYRDEWLVAVNKPSGLPTHATHDPERDHAHAAVQRLVGGGYVGVHHRLDVDTSGVLVFTVDRAANKGLADAFAERRAKKTYAAVVTGAFEPTTVENHLGRDRHIDRMREVHSGGDYARTTFELQTRGDRGTLVTAYPHTGRTHQIRVHLAGIGTPIAGDTVYGGVQAKRLLLHARRLVVEHPITGATLELEAALPVDFVNAARPFGLELS